MAIDYEKIETSLDELPKEVKDFLYKGAFTRAINDIATAFSLSEEQKKSLDYHTTLVIILMEHRDDLIHLAEQWGLSPAQQQTFMEKIEASIIVPIVQATNYTEDEEENTDTVNAPS